MINYIQKLLFCQILGDFLCKKYCKLNRISYDVNLNFKCAFIIV